MAARVENGPAVEVEGLEKRYPKAPANAVDGVTFTVQEGEVFGPPMKIALANPGSLHRHGGPSVRPLPGVDPLRSGSPWALGDRPVPHQIRSAA